MRHLVVADYSSVKAAAIALQAISIERSMIASVLAGSSGSDVCTEMYCVWIIAVA